jgi:cytochrome c-type biogenesis protein CcsB
MYADFINVAFIFYGLAFFLYLFGFKKEIIPTLSYGLLLAGIINNFIAILFRWFASGHPPLSSLYDVILLLAFLLSSGCLFVDFIFNLKFILGFFGAFFSLLALGYTSFFGSITKPLIPQLKSNWILIHVTTYLLGYTAAFIAFIIGILYLIKSRNSVIDKNHDFLKKLDEIGYISVMTCFPLLTLGLTTGAVWANVAWAHYWDWDPKENWALITWIIYVVYIHLHLKGWRGRKMAYIAIIGFATILFTLIGVTFFLISPHSYEAISSSVR